MEKGGNAFGILSIEFMADGKSLDFLNFYFGKGVTEAYQVNRENIEHLEEDQPLYPDYNTSKIWRNINSCRKRRR